jgi:H+/gluconate symporter-like permease
MIKLVGKKREKLYRTCFLVSFSLFFFSALRALKGLARKTALFSHLEEERAFSSFEL